MTRQKLPRGITSAISTAFLLLPILAPWNFTTPFEDPWTEKRLVDLKPCETFQVGIHSIRWTADRNGNQAIDREECEVLQGTANTWIAMEPPQYENLVKWQILEELDTSPSTVYRRSPTRPLRLYVDLSPVESMGTLRPALLTFFGGSWSVGYQGEFAPWTAHFAKRGMVCFRADYQVGTRDGTNESTGLRATRDARAALRWVISNAPRFGVDPTRIITMGESAGGHLALCAALSGALEDGNDPPLVRHVPAIISGFPISRHSDRRLSPFDLMQSNSPPLFLTWGTKDVFAPALGQFVEHIRTLGHDTAVHIEPDAGHGYMMWGQYRDAAILRVDQFLTRHGVLPPDGASTGKVEVILRGELWSSYLNGQRNPPRVNTP